MGELHAGKLFVGFACGVAERVGDPGAREQKLEGEGDRFVGDAERVAGNFQVQHVPQAQVDLAEVIVDRAESCLDRAQLRFDL